MSSVTQIYEYFVILEIDVVQTLDGHREVAAIGAVALKIGNFKDRRFFAGFCQSQIVSDNMKRYPFKEIMHNFLRWLRNLKGSFVFVTEGYSKLAFDLHNQCSKSMSDVSLPDYFHCWFNIVKFWKQRYGNHKISRDMLLDHFGQNYQGHGNEPRSAKWTSIDLANVFVQVFLSHTYVVFRENEHIQLI